MTTGQRIRAVRKEKGLTQQQLAKRLDISASAIGQFETNPNSPKIETLEKIAAALEVPILYLIGETKQIPSDMALDQKLSHIGYSIGFDEENSSIWIKYPDGSLEVSEKDLETLNTVADAFMKFQLEQLRITHKDDFRSY